MSLTRDEWCLVWESIKKIERLSDYHFLNRPDVEKKVKKEVEFIKDKIQQVIGQME